MRISDWSSDVCSSDLHVQFRRRLQRRQYAGDHLAVGQRLAARQRVGTAVRLRRVERGERGRREVFDVHRLAQAVGVARQGEAVRSEEHTSELQSLMRISYAVFCLKKKNKQQRTIDTHTRIQV